MAMTPKLWSISAAAVELKKDRRTIAAALRDVQPDGKISARAHGWRLDTILSALSPATADAGDLDLNEQRARLAKEQADAAEMKNAMMRRELLPASDVAAYLGAALARVRARLLAVPPKAAPLCHAAGSVARAEIVIREAITEALLELSGTTIEDMCGGAGDDVGDPEAAAEADGQRMGGSGAEAEP